MQKNTKNNSLENRTSTGEVVDNNKPILSYEEFNEKTKNLRTLSDVTQFTKKLLAPTIQKMLEAEMEHHVGYPKSHVVGNLSGNSRNGYYDKKIRTTGGDIKVQIPRDRNGNFEPTVVRKYETVESDVEERIEILLNIYLTGIKKNFVKT